MRQTGLPDTVWLGPELSREPFGQVLLVVRERNYDGTPRILEVIAEDDDEFEIDAAADLFSAYVPEGVTRPC